MNASPDRVRASAVFDSVRALPAAEQAARLQAECGDDPALLAEVNALRVADVLLRDRLRPTPHAKPIPDGHAVEGYDIVRRLDGGNQADVYLATRPQIDQPFVIKVLDLGQPNGEPEATRRLRFDREIDILKKFIHHPHVARLFERTSTKDQSLCCVMAYVHGLPLDEYVRRVLADTPGDRVATLLRLFVMICRAVHDVHQAGVIHRDLKPANILVDLHGHPRVLDFGISAISAVANARPNDSKLTEVGKVANTPRWAAPEQLLGGHVDARADVFALGVILFQMLRGGGVDDEAFPYDMDARTDRPDAFSITDKRRRRPTAKPSAIVSRPDVRLDRLVLNAIAFNQKERYPSAAAFAEAIEMYLRRRSSVPHRVTRPLLLCGLALVVAAGVTTWVANRRGAATSANSVLASGVMVRPVGIVSQQPVAMRPGEPMTFETLMLDPPRRPGLGSMTVELPLHRQEVTAVAYSGDGQWLATAGRDATVRVWPRQGGRTPLKAGPAIILQHTGRGRSIAWRPGDNAVLAVGGSGPTGLALYDPASGRTLWSDHARELTDICWSPDGRRLAAACEHDDGVITLYDVGDDGRLRPGLRLARPGDGQWWQSIAFSPDGRSIAACCRDKATISVFDARSGERRSLAGAAFTEAECVAWSPSGTRLAVGGGTADGKPALVIWDMPSGRLARTMHGDGWVIADAVWSPDESQIATAAGLLGRPAVVWDVATGVPKAVSDASDPCLAIAWSADGGELAFGTNGSSVGVVRPPFAIAALDQEVATGALAFRSVLLSPDARRVALGGVDGIVRLWPVTPPDDATAAVRRPLRLPGASLVALAADWSDDGRRLVCAGDDTLAVWDVAAEPATLVRSTRTGVYPRQIRLSHDGQRMALVDDDQKIHLLPADDTRGNRDVETFDLGRTAVRALSYSSRDGRLALGRADGSVAFLALHGGGPKWLAGKAAVPVTALVWSPAGDRIAVAFEDKTIELWNPAAATPTVKLKLDTTGPAAAMRWTADGLHVLCPSSATTIQLTDPDRADDRGAWKKGAVVALTIGEYASDHMQGMSLDGAVTVGTDASPDNFPHVLTLTVLRSLVAPATPVRTRVVIGPDENVFEVGGHGWRTTVTDGSVVPRFIAETPAGQRAVDDPMTAGFPVDRR